MPGLFDVLSKEPDGLPAKEAIARLVELVPPTPYEAEHQNDIPEERRSLLPLTAVHYLDLSQ